MFEGGNCHTDAAQNVQLHECITDIQKQKFHMSPQEGRRGGERGPGIKMNAAFIART